jgi:hypothetical protein
LSEPFVIDTTGPAIVNLSLDRPQPLGPGQVYFTVTFNEPVDMEMPLTFELDLNKHGRYSKEEIPVNVAGNWMDNRTWRGIRIIFPEVGTGEYPIAVYGAVDLLGNPMLKNTSFSVLINTTRPTNNTNVTDDDVVPPDDDVTPPDDDDIIPDTNRTSDDDEFDARYIIAFAALLLIIIAIAVIAAVAYRRRQGRLEKEMMQEPQAPAVSLPPETLPGAGGTTAAEGGGGPTDGPDMGISPEEGGANADKPSNAPPVPEGEMGGEVDAPDTSDAEPLSDRAPADVPPEQELGPGQKL